jgi:choline kinase
MINICVPTLKRYDLLRRMVVSLRTEPVDKVWVIDNGRDPVRVRTALASCPIEWEIVDTGERLSVAESWNLFLQIVDEERIIVNDDILFTPGSIDKLLNADADLIWAATCGFSCFVLRDACIEKIGFFDESISPGYGYYEDEDYLQRLDGRGTRAPSAIALEVEAGVQHLRSQTLAVATPAERAEHDRRFQIAQRNYAKKWHLEAAFGLKEMETA